MATPVSGQCTPEMSTPRRVAGAAAAGSPRVPSGLKTSQESQESQWAQNSPSVVPAHRRFEPDEILTPGVVSSPIRVDETDSEDEEDGAVGGGEERGKKEDKKERGNRAASAVRRDLRMDSSDKAFSRSPPPRRTSVRPSVQEGDVREYVRPPPQAAVVPEEHYEGESL